MSAVFKNSKKKLVQSEFRKILNEQKGLKKDVKKIESPLAKYNDQGQLTCILCKSIVRSEAVWTVHINAKQHRENVEIAKKLKERTNNFTTPLKRPLTPPLEVPSKKPKSILKNSTANSSGSTVSSTKDSKNGLPEDFFQSKSGGANSSNLSSKTGSTSILPVLKPTESKMEVDKPSDEILPEGFFDDPKLDAKARNQEYKDPVEEEWERFQKEIREADNKSSAIIDEDWEEATNERDIDEVEEQLTFLSRVVSLEKKKENIVSTTNKSKNMDFDGESSEDESEDVDEFLDWRSKKSYK